jgi:hypothetical protein
MCLQDEPEHFFWNEITGEVQWEGMLPTTAQQMAQRVSQPASQPASTSQPATPTIDQSAIHPSSQPAPLCNQPTIREQWALQYASYRAQHAVAFSFEHVDNCETTLSATLIQAVDTVQQQLCGTLCC